MAEIAPQTGRDHAEIEQVVQLVIAAELKVAASDVDLARDLRNVDGIDSVKALRVIAQLERKYDVEMTDQQVFTFKTGEDIVAALAEATRRDGA